MIRTVGYMCTLIMVVMLRHTRGTNSGIIIDKSNIRVQKAWVILLLKYELGRKVFFSLDLKMNYKFEFI